MNEYDVFFSHLGKKLYKIFGKALKNSVFPGAAVGIGAGRGIKEKYSAVFGRLSFLPGYEKLTAEVYYDLASLTKPLVTSLAVLCLIKDKKIALSHTLDDLLEQEIDIEKQKITLFHLLNHCSGLPAHRYYHLELIKYPCEERLIKLISFICAEPLIYETGKLSVYSDLGFMLLGRIVEIKSGKKLAEYIKEKIFSPLGLENDLFFNNIEKPKKGIYAPTADCPWRHKIVCGVVHDDNCYALGGVAGHAGLFGNIRGVLDLVCFLSACQQEKAGLTSFNNDDLRKFLKKQDKVTSSSWALGFDTPSPGCSSGGKLISPQSVGHLGFSGTSFWIDPVRELVMVLLSNRIHPDPANEKIKQFRPYFHDTVIDVLDKELK